MCSSQSTRMFLSSSSRDIMAPSPLCGLWKQPFPAGRVRSSFVLLSLQGQSTSHLHNAILSPLPTTGTEAHTITCLLSSHIPRSPGFRYILPVSWKQLCRLPTWLSLERTVFLPCAFRVLLGFLSAFRPCSYSSINFDHIVWNSSASSHYSALHFTTNCTLRSELYSLSNHAGFDTSPVPPLTLEWTCHTSAETSSQISTSAIDAEASSC